MPTPIVINTTAAWPGAIDTFVNVPVGGNQQLLDHEGMHNKDHNVLAAMQADIGVTGATGPSTLRGRIKTLEAGGGGGGSAGATGATGPTGSAGATGVAGVSGAAGKNAGLNYVFDSDITSTAPASGSIKFNAVSPAQTLMRISHTDADANLITTLLQSLYASTAPTKCTLTIIKAGDPSTVLCLGITAGVAFGGREEYTVSYINANNTFANGDSIIVQFSVAGNNGIAGATGAIGATGAAGSTGATGIGATGAAGATGAGSSTYNSNTTLTASAGNDTITLDQTPLANPDTTFTLIVNGSEIMSGITWVGNVATLGTALTAGQKVRVKYQSTVSPAASTLTTSTPPATYTYVRINITANGGNSSYLGLCEIIIAATIGGSTQTSGGTASASSSFNGSNLPAQGFDGSLGTNWLAGSTANEWIQIYKATPMTVAQVRIAGHSATSSNAGINPQDFTILGSNDGTTFTNLSTQAGITGWANATYKNFTI